VSWKKLIKVRKIVKVFTNQPFIYVIISDFVCMKIQEMYPYVIIYVSAVNKLIFMKSGYYKNKCNVLQIEEYIY